MVNLVVFSILPVALRLLPGAMQSLEALAMLTAIGLQESKFLARHQRPAGTAHGFWQFERTGVRAVLTHPSTRDIATEAMHALRYDTQILQTVHNTLEHNDVLAAIFARLLLWSDPEQLPGPEDHAAAWQIYLRTWNPGKPRPATWRSYYKEAWDRVLVAQALPLRKDNPDAARFDRRGPASSLQH